MQSKFVLFWPSFVLIAVAIVVGVMADATAAERAVIIQREFVAGIPSALIAMMLIGFVYFATTFLVSLLAGTPIFATNEVLMDLADRGYGAAAGELAQRMVRDPVQKRFWANRAHQLGFSQGETAP